MAGWDSHPGVLLRPDAPGGDAGPLGPQASGQVSSMLLSSVCFMLEPAPLQLLGGIQINLYE